MFGDKQRVIIIGVKAWVQKCTNFGHQYFCSLDLSQQKNLHNYLVELDGKETFRQTKSDNRWCEGLGPKTHQFRTSLILRSGLESAKKPEQCFNRGTGKKTLE
jgi:hypothetical protein